ncbi:RIOK1, partial [Symbiodinium sp. KB8]
FDQYATRLGVAGSTSATGGKVAMMQPKEHQMEKIKDKLDFEKLEGAAAPAPRHTGRDDRATTEQVLDPRTRMILFKLISQGLITSIHGCVSTGKEANVYHAVRASDGADLAIKVFKTSILVFKDRDRYVTGEYRFRTGYCKSNPRKMVKLWAEKEMRNLKR